MFDKFCCWNDGKWNCIYSSIIILMKDQERQASFKYGHFDVTLRMSSEDTLSVAVENSHTLQKYSQSINREYISQQDTFFQSVFEEALDIYDYLRTIINEIVIEGELLLFDYRYGKSKVKRISIQLLKEDIDPVEQAHLRAEKMKEHFTAQLFQKDVEIKELQQKYEQIAQKLHQTKGEVQANKIQTRELAETWRAEFKQLKDELQMERAKSRELGQALRANSEKLEGLTHVVSLIQVEQKKQKIMKEIPEQAKIRERVGHHPNNAHKKYYTLTNLTGTSARITRIGVEGYYNFVNKCEILPNQKAKYSLTINITKNNYIYVGFCTEKGLGNINNQGHAESAYYSCAIGYVFEGGPGKSVGVVTRAGETVECVADLASSKFSWWKKGNRFAECIVPVGMRNKPIYVSLLFSSIGDEADFVFEAK